MFLQLWQTQTSFEQPSVFFTCWLGVGCQSNFGKEGSKRAGYLSSGSSPAFSCLQLIINVSFGVSYMLSPKLLQSHLTLCNPVDCSPPGFSVHGILQAPSNLKPPIHSGVLSVAYKAFSNALSLIPTAILWKRCCYPLNLWAQQSQCMGLVGPWPVGC